MIELIVNLIYSITNCVITTITNTFACYKIHAHAHVHYNVLKMTHFPFSRDFKSKLVNKSNILF